MKKKTIYYLLGSLVLSLTMMFWFNYYKKEDVKVTDSQRFALEYTQVTEDNLFVYRNLDEIINILEKGTGVVYLGFPECPWCQAYVPILNEVAKEVGTDKIFYFNILEERRNNTEKYQKIVSLLDGYLLNDEEGKPRVFVPDITVVKNGEIIMHDNETSVVTDADGTPEQYWTNDKKNALKNKLKSALEIILTGACESNCNE